MKKLTTFLLAMAVSISLVACGGADKKPAIEAFNKASAAFNEVAAVINQNPEAYDEEVVDTMIEVANALNEHQKLLKGDTDIEEEKLNEMIEWYKSIEGWAGEVKADLGI